jgi:hypothetical protein
VAAIHAAHGQGQHGADENAEGVQDDAGRKTREGREEGMSSLMEVIANVSAGADKKASATVGSSHSGAYSSDCSVELPFRPSARAAAPAGPSLVHERLRARERRWVVRSVNGR